MVNLNLELFEKAYKKLKSSVYFDKTQLVLRNDIVEFENSKNFKKVLNKMFQSFSSEAEFNTLCNKILNSISIVSFPKKLKSNESDIIVNSVPKNNEIGELQYFINMDVEGHILGVLWLILIGYKIDQNVYKHSYGNRIRKKLLNEISNNPTYSPYLFEPYFEQYESWRDTAMSEATKHLSLKQDVVIITMDFRRFYYSVDMNKAAFEKLFKDAEVEEDVSEEDIVCLMRLNNFVCDVVEKYASLFDSDVYNNMHILPIGFLPSNVIANWCLKNFDKAVVDGWNPVYYGRYVDDVLIINKVEHNSDIYNKAKNNELTREGVINFFLKQCSKWNGVSGIECQKGKEFALIQEDIYETQKAIEKVNKKYKKVDSNNIHVFRVNSRYNPIPDDNSKIIVHNDKVKVFYFKSGESDALITCFKEKIMKNKSEFRHMPEDEAYFQRDDYNEIFVLKNSDTLNKLRGIEGISIDKFELSKFLGKHLRIGGLIDDKAESKFEQDILKIFSTRVMIENYTVWEKVIEIFVINERFQTARRFINKTIEAIDSIKYDEQEDKTVSAGNIKSSLYLFLHSAICRSFALVWNPEVVVILNSIYLDDRLEEKLWENINFWKDMKYYDISDGHKSVRVAYCKSRMVDNSVMPIAMDMLSKKRLFSSDSNINLTRFYDVLNITKTEWKSFYKYHPYMVTMYDFSMISCIEEIKKKEQPFVDLSEIYKRQAERYIECNYALVDEDNTSKKKIMDLVKIKLMDYIDKDAYQIVVGDSKKNKLKIAIANVQLYHNNFELLVKDKPNRSYARYRDLSTLVNQAVDQKADMLVMPESFVPFEWLSTLARTCARNSLAVVTGVEHIKYKTKIFNLTATILPYTEDNHKCAYLAFHLKKHYAPSEKQVINGYRLSEVEGQNYELYKWNDCYFPVYCCYELASVKDRALFRSYADMIVAVEWNRDVKYYSNILESLSRDIHCFCVQVNSSDYGDSRITKPSKTQEKDIIRTKGGKNSTILVDEIDIGKLRDFQLKEYELQCKNTQFKTTPPDFNKDVVMAKIKGIEI